MSTSFPRDHDPRTLHTPGAALQRTARAMWDLLQDLGALRARQHLLALSREQQALNPALAARLREAARRSMMG
jgi:hypothetical protein